MIDHCHTDNVFNEGNKQTPLSRLQINSRQPPQMKQDENSGAAENPEVEVTVGPVRPPEDPVCWTVSWLCLSAPTSRHRISNLVGSGVTNQLSYVWWIICWYRMPSNHILPALVYKGPSNPIFITVFTAWCTSTRSFFVWNSNFSVHVIHHKSISKALKCY